MRVPTRKPRGNSNRKKRTTYRCKHPNAGEVGGCFRETGLAVELVDDALCALSTFDRRFSASDREIAEHIIDRVDLDTLSAYRFVRALRGFYADQVRSYVWLHGEEPDWDGAS